MAGWQEYLDVERLKSLVTTDEGSLSWDVAKNNFIESFNELRQVTPGFFTPFKGKKDLALTLAVPIIAPFALSALATVLTIGAGIAAVVCVGSLLVAAATSVFDSDTRESALTLALMSAVATVGCVIFAAAASLVATVATIAGLSYLATRTGTSIAHQQGRFSHLSEYEVIPNEPVSPSLGS